MNSQSSLMCPEDAKEKKEITKLPTLDYHAESASDTHPMFEAASVPDVAPWFHGYSGAHSVEEGPSDRLADGSD